MYVSILFPLQLVTTQIDNLALLLNYNCANCDKCDSCASLKYKYKFKAKLRVYRIPHTFHNFMIHY